MKGFFLTIEGGEGAGKTTLQKALARSLRRRGYRVRLTREPGGTPLGRRLRKELLQGAAVDPTAELLLYAADRAQHVAAVIRPALDAGDIVICDRYSDSTVAYQRFGRKLDPKEVDALNRLAEQGVRPHLTLWLDIAVEEGLRRARGRGPADRFESETLRFHRRVRRGFRSLSEKEPRRVRRLDAGDSPKDILAAALPLVEDRLRRRGYGI